MTRTILAVLLLALAPAARAAETPRDTRPASPTARALLQHALDLWHHGADPNEVMRAFNAAVKAWPDDIDVHFERATFLQYVARHVDDSQADAFAQLARDDYRFVTEHAPNSRTGAVARDGLALLEDRQLLPVVDAPCPAEAKKAFQAAEQAFVRHDFEAAIPSYEKAAALCPKSATIRLSYADAFFALREYTRAHEQFSKALEADPWNRQAHRFLADTDARLDDIVGAAHEAALAVVADPTYEAGWQDFREYQNLRGRTDWGRVFSDKVQVVIGAPGEDGKGRVEISVPESIKNASTSDDTELWMTYGFARAVLVTGAGEEPGEDAEAPKKKVDPKTLGALELDRRTVARVLGALREKDAAAGHEVDAPFWRMMARADKAGFLVEAIYLHLLDAALVPEFQAFRAKNAARLAEYLEKVVATAPTAPAGDVPPKEPATSP